MELNRDIFEYVLAPVVSAQLFFTILLYFTIVRKRISADYKLYNLFLSSFTLFLIGRMAWVYASETNAVIVLYVRMFLLLGIGIPSLLIATAKQSGIRSSKSLYILPYSMGVILAINYILFFDYGTLHWFVSDSIVNIDGIKSAHKVQIVGAIIQLILPCSILIIKEILGRRQLKLLLFLAGGVLFGLSLVIGIGTEPQNIGLYYIASIPVGGMWIWAVFLDINDMKGKVSLLKEELQFIIKSDQGVKTKEVKSLLENLEEVSYGDLEIYKMRIREILMMFTDTTIEAGGDKEALLQRNAERTHAILESEDAKQVNEIIFSEAQQLSEMISDNPLQKNTRAVKTVVDYLQEHYDEDLSVDQIALIAGLSKAHLMREFKKTVGQTILQFQTKLRIEAAQQHLFDTSVSDTAYKVGYNNPNYFSTVFRKITGKSPLEYQEQLSNIENKSPIFNT
ncbi:AraC family transcriptional regulator [Flammeovirga pacifica]|uniref:HTH araC/xylS-type domain-containing protein n=1 Tax=Flammeovirga pacifica TaxID=915059 RepID=A0A1S1YTT5_FLAPC|nr:helix-turn-helix domain-containing protein [Flammeovirga pacifica]OHX64442.1 hypothetical protein NH26_22920 [Flammeovirga pacifica]